MDHLPAIGTAIGPSIAPTMKLYDPLLQANARAIKSVPISTHQYGPHERQVLDIYTPHQPSLINGRAPVLLFEYGGGLVTGGRTIPTLPSGLAYANVGAFFARNFGYTVVIADYRLMSHGARFPSGGEDIGLAVEWIVQNREKVVPSGTAEVDLFIMGNSAGGIHLSTFLFHEACEGTRRKVLKDGSGVRLRGAVLLSVPFHFGQAAADRAKTLTEYFGDVEGNSPRGLLKRAKKPCDFVQAGTRVLVLNGELDPEEEILVPRDDFLKEWLTTSDNATRGALAVEWMLGHNHISPVAALSTGIEKEEAWGCQVAAFCDNIRKFAAR